MQEQLLVTGLIYFLAIWGLLLVGLVIHIGWINSRWKLLEWPTALYYVAVADRKTRNDFWHLVANALLIAAFVVMILFSLGKLGHV